MSQFLSVLSETLIYNLIFLLRGNNQGRCFCLYIRQSQLATNSEVMSPTALLRLLLINTLSQHMTLVIGSCCLSGGKCCYLQLALTVVTTEPCRVHILQTNFLYLSSQPMCQHVSVPRPSVVFQTLYLFLMHTGSLSCQTDLNGTESVHDVKQKK